MPEVITSRQNARVRILRAALRGAAPPDMAAIEGWTILQEALAAQQRGTPGLEIKAVFLRTDKRHLTAELPSSLDILLLSPDAFDSTAVTEHSQGIAALLRKPQHTYNPTPGDLLILAAGLQDPGNLGTLIRSAEAFGAAAVLLADAVDPWNGKALRASAGSVFRMPLPRWTDALHTALRAARIRLLATVPDPAATPAHLADLRNGCALLIGNEGRGLSPALLALADEPITLPMTGPTESLNAAVAASILLYEASRQRLRL